jgi:hypothetical protein
VHEHQEVTRKPQQGRGKVGKIPNRNPRVSMPRRAGGDGEENQIDADRSMQHRTACCLRPSAAARMAGVGRSKAATAEGISASLELERG